MTAKQIDIQLRKDKILSITVEQYIKTVSPVSSSLLAEGYFEDLSPATIRNILAELEEEGFLTHPHTSAGRVPTQKGYRYYVDNLMNEIQLLQDEKTRIKAAYEKDKFELDVLLDKTSRMLSDLTSYTSIISVDGWDSKLIYHGTSFIADYPDYQDIAKIKHILNALDEKERLLKIINRDLQDRIDILIGNEIKCDDIDSCSLVISGYKTKDLSGRIAVLGPTRMNYKKVISALDYLTELMNELY